MVKSTRTACATISPLRWGRLDFLYGLGYTPIAMDFPRVYYLKSINPIEILKEADKETYEYLAKLQQNDKLLEFVKKLYSTSPNLPIDIKQFEGQNLDDLEMMKNEFLRLPLDFTVDYILQEIGLTKEFHIQILLLIYFNSIIDIKYFEGFVPKDIEFVVGRKNIINMAVDSKHELCSLNIPFLTSQRGLIAYIRQNWCEMEKQMNENLSQNPYIKKTHLNTQIGIEIADLKDNKNKTFEEIADILTPIYLDKFPSVADVNWIKKIYRDFKIFFSSLNQ